MLISLVTGRQKQRLNILSDCGKSHSIILPQCNFHEAEMYLLAESLTVPGPPLWKHSVFSDEWQAGVYVAALKDFTCHVGKYWMEHASNQTDVFFYFFYCFTSWTDLFSSSSQSTHQETMCVLLWLFYCRKNQLWIFHILSCKPNY